MELVEACQQKDDIINKLQATMEDATRDVNMFITHDQSDAASHISVICPTSSCVSVWFQLSSNVGLSESPGGGHQVGASAASADLLLCEEDRGGGWEQETTALHSEGGGQGTGEEERLEEQEEMQTSSVQPLFNLLFPL